MIIDFNGKSLSNSCDILFYYKKFTNRELFADLFNFQNSIQKGEDGKINMVSLLNNTNLFEMFKNLYFAGRCAFEDKALPLSILKNELDLKTMFDVGFYDKMFELLGNIMPTDSKKKD